MSEESATRKRYRSDGSSEETLWKKPKFQASASVSLQLSIDEAIRLLCAYQSDLRRGCVASKGSILAVLDAMRAEIIGGAASDKHSLRLILPDEVLLDIFVYLDRLRLEKLQHACRRFRTIVDLHMTDVCYRVIHCVHVQGDYFDRTVTACIGNREYGGPLDGTPLLTSEVSEHGERRTIMASKLDRYKNHLADVLANVCRNANVLVYKITKMCLYEAWRDMYETWPKLVPADAHRVTVSEFVLDECIVEAPHDGKVLPETIVMRMLERFRRVRGVRLSVRLQWHGLEADRDVGFTDQFLEFSAAHGIGAVRISNWDKGISEKGVINFLLNAPSDHCERELWFGGAKGVTARFYDVLVKASTECTTAHAASLHVSNCEPDSLPDRYIRDADEEDGGAWGDTEYRFFRGLLPFSIVGESSCSGTFFSYKRGVDVRRNEDQREQYQPAQDDNADNDQVEDPENDEEEDEGNDQEEDDGNHFELGNLELVDEC